MAASEHSMSQVAMQKRIEEMTAQINHLLSSPSLPYADATPSKFPQRPGLYVISDSDGNCLRAGKTRVDLQQRLYRNHLMGSQSGNLRAQLVGSGVCSDLVRAKEWIRQNCSVRWLEVLDEDARNREEHFMLAVLRPRYCDKNQWNNEES